MRMDKNKVGMFAFLGSEGVFFIFLIIAYVYLHSTTTQGPNAAQTLNPLTAGIYTLFLLASSLTVWAAGRDMRRSHSFRAGLWLLLSIILGVIFLLGQGSEWARLIRGNVVISTNGFTTGFFTLTGFHGLHVTIGLLALAIVLILAWSGRIRGPGSSALEALSIYWHFVDAVWIVIFATIYLSVVIHV
jgi:heme/copper-type cytochrome/quinol oxidase subunit 3